MPESPSDPHEVDLSPGATVAPAESLSGRDRTALWWVLAVVLVGQAIGLFSPGNAALPEPLYVDKVIHAAMFGLPVYLLGRLTRHRWLWAWVFVVYAALSEIIQFYLVPGRDGDVFDFTADVVGIAIALLALRWHRTAA